MGEKKILVVDDEDSIREVFNEYFTEKGYLVRLAESASEALQILSKEQISVIFLDLNMPEMNGIELCKKIKEDHPINTCIAITGYTSIFQLVECREAGFDDYFSKPVKFEKLLKVIEFSFEKHERWKGK